MDEAAIKETVAIFVCHFHILLTQNFVRHFTDLMSSLAETTEMRLDMAERAKIEIFGHGEFASMNSRKED